MLTPSRDIRKRLEREGWSLEPVRGSHHAFRNSRTGAIIVLPAPKKDFGIGLARAIYRQAGWPPDPSPDQHDTERGRTRAVRKSLIKLRNGGRPSQEGLRRMADTSDDPVELLARHMHRQHAKTPFGQGEIWAEIRQERRSYWRQMARATFDALGMRRRPWLRLIGRST